LDQLKYFEGLLKKLAAKVLFGAVSSELGSLKEVLTPFKERL
jgi:hypothetical protein